jgi:hypothetical protein
MKGALSSKPNYQFDANGNLVGSEDDTPESLFLKESIVLYVEGQSANHPADVAASNAPTDPPPPEALAVQGRRNVFSEAEVEESDMEEAEGTDDTPSHRGRRRR